MRVLTTTAPDGAHPHELAVAQRADLRSVYVSTSTSDGASAGARAMTVMEALGKSADVTGARDHASLNVPLMTIWLLAHRTQLVVMPDIGNVAMRTVRTLMRALSAWDGDLLVVDRPFSHRSTMERINGFGPTHLTWERARTMVGDCSTSPAGSESPAVYSVPDSDWYTFRADCRGVLDVAAFAEADAEYCEQFAATTALLESGFVPDTESLRMMLAKLTLGARSTAVAVCRVRAVQAALFAAGWNLRVHRQRLLQRLASGRSQRFGVHDFRALRAYRDPQRSALCVLHDAGLSKTALTGFTVQQAADALDMGVLNGLTLHPDAAPLLSAAVMHRRMGRAEPDAPLFAATRETVGRMLNRAATDLGLFVGHGYEGENRNTLAYWQIRDGFVCERIGS